MHPRSEICIIVADLSRITPERTVLTILYAMQHCFRSISSSLCRIVLVNL